MVWGGLNFTGRIRICSSSRAKCSEWFLLAYESLVWCWRHEAGSHYTQSLWPTKPWLQSVVKFPIVLAVWDKYANLSLAPVPCSLHEQHEVNIHWTHCVQGHRIMKTKVWPPTSVQFTFNGQMIQATTWKADKMWNVFVMKAIFLRFYILIDVMLYF